MSSHQRDPAELRYHVAEHVLPGHPDRIADAIAERLVDLALRCDPDALVAVEVAVFRERVFVTGRIAAGAGEIGEEVVAQAARGAFEAAGYAGRFALAPGAPRVECELKLGPLSPEERAIRRFSDDQNIAVGHASGSRATGWLPPAPLAARRLARGLARVRKAQPETLGPDGKLLIRVREEAGRFALDLCNASIQHVEGVACEVLHRLVLPALRREAKLLDEALPGFAASWSGRRVRLNGAGDFSCGGTHGDNGLSGKKLVVDHYGPGVPIGGGALCGKDPHKVDRVGALRARQLAVRLVRDFGAREATVRLGFLPGLEAPSFLDATVDGACWDERRIHSAIAVPDLSIEASFRELELGRECWSDLARLGYFGRSYAWER